MGFLSQLPKDNYLPLNLFAHFGLYFPSLASKENPSLYATLSCPSSKELQSPNLSGLPLTGVFKFYPMAPSFLQNYTRTFPRKARFPDKRVCPFSPSPHGMAHRRPHCVLDEGSTAGRMTRLLGLPAAGLLPRKLIRHVPCSPAAAELQSACHCPGLGVEGLVPASPAAKLCSPDTELLLSSSSSVFSKMDTTRVVTRLK